jgi:hypothetical protein
VADFLTAVLISALITLLAATLDAALMSIKAVVTDAPAPVQNRQSRAELEKVK